MGTKYIYSNYTHKGTVYSAGRCEMRGGGGGGGRIFYMQYYIRACMGVHMVHISNSIVRSYKKNYFRIASIRYIHIRCMLLNDMHASIALHAARVYTM